MGKVISESYSYWLLEFKRNCVGAYVGSGSKSPKDAQNRVEHVAHEDSGCQGDHEPDLPVELRQLGGHHEERSAALGVAHVRQIGAIGRLQDVVDHGGKVVDSHFVPA